MPPQAERRPSFAGRRPPSAETLLRALRGYPYSEPARKE